MSPNRPILFVDHAAALGGAEHSLLMLLERLNQHGWQPHLACAPQGLAAVARERGVPVHPIDLPRLRRSARFFVDWVRGARALAELSKEIGALALYSNTVRATFYSAPAAKLARRPFIWHMRDFWLSEAQPKHMLADRMGKRLMLATASAVITNSKAVARNLPASEKVRIVHNGIDVAQFTRSEKVGEFRKQHGVPLKSSLVGMVGRLRPWKGQDRFLRVASRVLAEREDVHFMIVGGSPLSTDSLYPQVLRRLVQALDIEARVHFTGQLDDVRPALSAMDIFVHPGDPEPFGLVNVEAMAMGLPVVAFNHGALPEIVEDRQTGRLVTPEDGGEMARAIIDLLDDSETRKQMGENGRRRAAQDFDVARTVQGVNAVLQELTDTP
ncbi:MAG: glycosyltransferase family 4 protein [Chloroflexota bacterium]